MTLVQYARSTTPPPLLVLFGLRLPPLGQGLVMLVSPSVTHVSTISLHPLHLRVLYSAVCVWANISEPFQSNCFHLKPLMSSRNFFFRMQFVTEHNPLGGWMGVIHTDQSSVWLLHKKYSYCTMQVTVQRVNVY